MLENAALKTATSAYAVQSYDHHIFIFAYEQETDQFHSAMEECGICFLGPSWF